MNTNDRGGIITMERILNNLKRMGQPTESDMNESELEFDLEEPKVKHRSEEMEKASSTAYYLIAEALNRPAPEDYGYFFDCTVVSASENVAVVEVVGHLGDLEDFGRFLLIDTKCDQTSAPVALSSLPISHIIRVQEVALVSDERDYSENLCPHELLAAPYLKVTEFHMNCKPSVHTEVVVIANTHGLTATVLGPSFREPICITWPAGSRLKKQNLYIADVYKLKDFIKKVIVGSRCYYLKDYEEEMKSADALVQYDYSSGSDISDNLSIVTDLTSGTDATKIFKHPRKNKAGTVEYELYNISDLKPVTAEQYDWIRSYGATIPRPLSIDMAHLFVRDPFVCASLLNRYLSLLEAEKYTIETEVRLKKVFELNSLSYEAVLLIPEHLADRLMGTPSSYTWRLGADLMFEAEIQGQKINCFMAQVKTMSVVNESWLIVCRVLQPFSPICQILMMHQNVVDWSWRVGIHASHEDSSSAIMSGFDDFFGGDRALFRAWCGYQTANDLLMEELPPIELSDKTIAVNACGRGHTLYDSISHRFVWTPHGTVPTQILQLMYVGWGSKSISRGVRLDAEMLDLGVIIHMMHRDNLDTILDDSQALAMLTASSYSGFTCVVAPPGSGKTLLTAALVHKRLNMGDDRVIISAHTNVAVTNVVQMINDRYPDYRTCREYSVVVCYRRYAHGDINDDQKRTSLSDMAKQPQRYIDMNNHPNVSKTFAQLKAFASSLQRHKRVPLKQGLKRNRKLRKLTLAHENAFREAYNPQIRGTTVDLLLRTRETKALHLILDEAGQVSAVSALAIYCSASQCERITLLGDPRQLPPYSELPRGSPLHNVFFCGELQRLSSLQCTAVRNLNVVYRSHPDIVDMLLKPIYGDHLVSGVTREQRALTSRHRLPVANNGVPVLFVQVNGASTDCGENDLERSVALDLMRHVMKSGVSYKHIVFICHHRGQRSALIEDINRERPLGDCPSVHTVDSFQGMEAPVIIVLTTKTANPMTPIEVRRRTLAFVSDDNRETVAVSRAQDAIYLLGDWDGLALTDFWSRFSAHVVSNAAFVDTRMQPLNTSLTFRTRLF